MTAFLVTSVIIGGLIVVGLLVNVYLYTQGVFRRRRARLRQQQEPIEEKRVTAADLDEQFYTSLGIGPNKPEDGE